MSNRTRRLGNNPSASPENTLRFGNAKMLRRKIILSCLAGFVPTSYAATLRSKPKLPLRIGTTAVFLDEQLQLLNLWRHDLQDVLDREIVFVQKENYESIVKLLLNKSIDVAWICGFPYALNSDKLRILVVPIYQSQPLYRSYLIVQETDQTTRRISDLKDCVFGYSDPLSNSGYLVPRVQLLQDNLDPSSFFRKTFYTYSHRKVVSAVASGLANAGAVDGYVWDTIISQFPDWAKGARVAWKSPEYGFPPLVTRQDMDASEFDAVQNALLTMSDRKRGNVVLSRLALDGFSTGTDHQYNSIRELMKINKIESASSKYKVGLR